MAGRPFDTFRRHLLREPDAAEVGNRASKDVEIVVQAARHAGLMPVAAVNEPSQQTISVAIIASN